MSENDTTYLDYFYNTCEKMGKFFGESSAYVINNTSFYLNVGYEGFKKGNDAYFNEVTSAYNNAYENITELYNESFYTTILIFYNYILILIFNGYG